MKSRGVVNTGTGSITVSGSAIGDDDDDGAPGIVNSGAGSITISGSAIGKGATVVVSNRERKT